MVDVKQKVLILGAGLVSTPLVEYLSRDKSVKLTTGKDSTHPNMASKLV